MNAVDPAAQVEGPASVFAATVVAPSGHAAARSSEHTLADRSALLLWWLTALYGAGVIALLSLRYMASLFPVGSVLAGWRLGGLAAVMPSSLLLGLTGLVGTWVMTWSRRRAAAELPTTRATGGRWRPRWASFRLPPPGDPALIGRMARWPQAIVVAGLASIAAAIPWLVSSPSGMQPVPPVSFILGATAIVLAFPLLIAERLVAATPASRLPEAPTLRTLLLVPELVWPAAGVVSIAAGLGIPFTGRVDSILAMLLTIVGVELSLRALVRCFLPPPASAAARAAIDSVIARMIAEGVRARSLVVPVRQQFGLDFSRGWALSFVRAAAPPVALLLVLLCWCMSGAVLVGLDQRAVYERFGAPVSVLHPGLHAILPWPMGQVRRLEFGVVHEMTLAGQDAALPEAATPVTQVGAEDLPPPEADRLWEQTHPGELTFLIASESAGLTASPSGGPQSFQVVSADIKVRYRIGLTDRDVLLAAYRVAQPAALLRAAASRAIAGFFAGRTLDAVLGENREAMAERLRVVLQKELDGIDPGIELAAVVIEAIHPPAGAAEAYHAVQAATILAETSISAERGRAMATRAQASQHASDIVAQSQAAGAEAISQAAGELTRFDTDHAAALAGGESFLLERRLTSLANSLSSKTLTIVDHRIPEADAPVLDLRPQSATTARSAGPDQE